MSLKLSLLRHVTSFGTGPYDIRAESRASDLLGRGEAARVSQVGEAEANVNRRKIEAYRDPMLFALNLLGEELLRSAQPLVPQRVLLFGQAQENGAAVSRIEASGLLPALMAMLVSEESGLNVLTPNDAPPKRDAVAN